MTEQTTTNSQPHPRRKPIWRRRPRWSVIGGIIFGAAFTFGYLANSFFYCEAQFSCSLSPFWLITIAVIGVAVGAGWGWIIGKFFRALYRVTRVD